MSAESNENTETTDNNDNNNDKLNENESKINNIEKEKEKEKSKKNDDDKNIHVPKDKKLKIEYVSVKNAFVHSDIVFYDIHVKTSQHYWHVTKRFVLVFYAKMRVFIYIYILYIIYRYSQFEELHNQLIQITKEKLPLLPAKHYKWFTDHTKPSFIEKRRALLDNYVKKLIKAKGVNSSQCVVNFFHNDKQAEEVIRKRTIQQEARLKREEEEEEEHEEEEEEQKQKQKEKQKREHRLSDEYDFPQDQEVTNIVIQSTRKMTDHVLYQICVSNSHKRSSFRAWTVLKRFTQFYEMDIKLRAGLQIQSPDTLPKLPPAPSRKLKFVHDHMDDDFIEERRVLLENYLSKLLRFPQVVQNEDFLEFLGVDM